MWCVNKKVSVFEESTRKKVLPNEKRCERKYREQVFILSHEMNECFLPHLMSLLSHTHRVANKLTRLLQLRSVHRNALILGQSWPNG